MATESTGGAPVGPDSSGPAGSAANSVDASQAIRTERLLDRQADALEQIVLVLDPSKTPKKKGIALFVGYMMLASSVVLGGYEFASWVIEQWERRAMLSNWIETAREMQDVENAPDMALELLAKAGEVDPQNADVVRLRAYVRGMQTVKRLLAIDRPFNTEDVAAANLAAAEAALLEKLDPEAPDWALLRGQLAMAQMESARARDYFERALALDPKNVLVRVRLADMHQDVGLALEGEGEDDQAKAEFLEAKRLLDEAVELDPRSKLAWLYRGIHQLNSDPEEAIVAFNRVIEIDGRFELALRNRGIAFFKLERFEDAESALRRALEVQPDSPALAQLAQIYGAQDEYESALLYAQKATDAIPGSLKAWTVRAELETDMGTIAIKAGRAEAGQALRAAASKSYSKAIELDPRNSTVLRDRSILLRLLGSLEEAGADARQAVRFAPEDADAWFALAEYQLAIGESASARRSLDRVLALNPRYDVAYQRLAQLLERDGDLSAAEMILSKAVEVAEDDFVAQFLRDRSGVRERRGDLAGALLDAVAAREAEPEQYELWLCEARLLIVLNRAEEACAVLVEANQRKPATPEVAELRARAGCQDA